MRIDDAAEILATTKKTRDEKGCSIFEASHQIKKEALIESISSARNLDEIKRCLFYLINNFKI